MPRSDSGGRVAARRGIRLASKILGFALIGAVCLTGIALLLLALPPARERLLHAALARADAALPGSLKVTHASWPGAGILEFEGISWVERGDTLLVLERARLELRVRALFARELEIEALALSGLVADVPALRDLLAAGGDRKAATASGGRLPYLREGGLPGLPSMSCGRFELEAPRLELTDSLTLLGTEAVATLELRRDRFPRLEISRLRFLGSPGQWALDETDLSLDLATRRCRAVIRGRLAPDWPVLLELDTDAQRRMSLKLAAGDGPTLLDLTGDWTETGDRLPLLGFEGRLSLPGTAELSRIPGMGGRLSVWPPLAGIQIELTGGVDPRRSPPSAELGADLLPNTWFDGGVARLAWIDGSALLDTLVLRVADLTIAASGRMGADSLSAAAGAEIAGSRWLERLLPETPPIDSLRATLAISAMGRRREPRVTATLIASGGRDSLLFDRLEANAELPADRRAVGRLSVELTGMGQTMRAKGEIDRTRSLSLRIAPLLLVAAGVEPPAPFEPHMEQAGRVIADPASGRLRADGLILDGDYGHFRLDVEPGDGEDLRLAIAASWTSVPAALARMLPVDVQPALRQAWRDGGPYSLSWRGTLSPEADGTTLRSEASFVLPGPRSLAPLLGPGLRTDDLGPLRGQVTLTASSGPSGSEAAMNLDLGTTAWIDSAQATLSARNSTLEITRAMIALPGLRIAGDGSREGDLWDASGRLTLDDSAWLAAHLVPAESSPPTLRLIASGRLRGSLAEPRLTLECTGDGEGPGYQLADLRANLLWEEGQAKIDLDLAESSSIGPFRIAGGSLRYTGEGKGSALLPGYFELSAHGQDFAYRHSVHIERDEGLSFLTDSLTLRLQKRELASGAPFRLHFDQERHSLRFTGLSLMGTIGRVTADGLLDPAGSDLTAKIDLVLPENSPFPDLPADLWPRSFRASVGARGKQRLEVDAEAGGIQLADGKRYDASLVAASAPEGLSVLLRVASGRDSLVLARLDLPPPRALYPIDSLIVAGPLRLDARIREFPLLAPPGGLAKAADGRPMRLNGRLAASGNTEDAALDADLRLGFPGWPKLGSHSLALKVEVKPAGTGGELKGALILRRGDKVLITTTARHPLRLSLLPPAYSVQGEGGLLLELKAEALALAEFDPLLPPNMGLQGIAGVNLRAEGPIGDAALSGKLEASKLSMLGADGSQLSADASLRIGGSMQAPQFSGRIDILKGVLRVPDKTRAAGGSEESLLWNLDRAQAPSDSGATAPGAARSTAGQRPRIRPEFDVTVSISSGLWLRGQGLDIELSGDLALVQKGGEPRLSGSLSAVEGYFKFLGRRFNVESGSVTFFGEDELDPALDLRLDARLQGTRVIILVGGSTKSPTLAFESDPEMSEGDIMSLIFFGRPLDELNGDQLNLLQQRASDMASAFGLAKLESLIARQIGVDMVSIRRDESKQSALTLGKYLSPKVLLKYEQDLGELQDFFINLEYFVSRDWKVETLYGQQGRSGLELIWTRER